MKTTLLMLVCVVSLQAQAPPCAISVELRAIYEADRSDRETGDFEGRDLVSRDADRSRRVGEILAAGIDPCPEDLYNAAMVYQHGGGAPGYLRAHVLAAAAAARGHQRARWLSAAALDRYLQAIEQPQIFGTQFNQYDDQPWTQEPFDRSFLSLPLRDLFNVADPAKQASRLDGLNNPDGK